MNKAYHILHKRQLTFIYSNVVTSFKILTLTIIVVSHGEHIATLFASALFESAEVSVTSAICSTNGSTASRCLAFRTAHTSWSPSSYNTFFTFRASHFSTTLCKRKFITVIFTNYYAVGFSFLSWKINSLSTI